MTAAEGSPDRKQAIETVRENVHHLARGCRSDMHHESTRYEQAIRAALAVLAEPCQECIHGERAFDQQKKRAERAEAEVAALRERLAEAERALSREREMYEAMAAARDEMQRERDVLLAGSTAYADAEAAWRVMVESAEAKLAEAERERDAWKRHAATSDHEVGNLRVGYAAVMEALAMPRMVEQLMWSDGALSIMRRINEIVDEAHRLAYERDAGTSRAESAERQLEQARTVIRGMLDASLRTMPGINPDGSASTRSMAETLAADFLVETTTEHPEGCPRCKHPLADHDFDEAGAYCPAEHPEQTA